MNTLIEKVLKNLVIISFGIVGATFTIPFVILSILITAPLILVINLFSRLYNQQKLKKYIKLNNGITYFIYADYNNFECDDYFRKNHPQIRLFKIYHSSFQVKEIRAEDPLINYMTRDCLNKSFPRLVKIIGDELVEKEHYNALKYYYKKNNDMASFLSLIEKSIKNLEAID